MQSRRYGPFPYVPITQRPRLEWPGGARLALWVIPNIEFFGLDDPMPGPANERLPKAGAHIPNVRNWSLRDYGNRVGIWRLMEIMERHGVRGTVALNSDICDHHPEIVRAAKDLGWEFMGHGQTNVVRIDELTPDEQRRVIHDTLARIAEEIGKKPVGWLGPGLAETWHTLDYLIDEGCLYVCDWVNDDQPYVMDIEGRRIYSIPYTLEANDVPLVFIHKVSSAEYERRLRQQFDVLYREGERSGRVMAIAIHPFVSGVPHRSASFDAVLGHICSHPGVWKATGEEIVRHYLKCFPPS